LTAIAKNELNISAAAESLFTSQPGVSKQIRLLEDELGVELFARNGKHLTHVTPVGREIIERAEGVLQEVRNIQILADEYRNDSRGDLSIATTHTQARYALPEVIRAFRERYPNVTLQLHQGSPRQIAELLQAGVADFAIATEAIELFEGFIMLPCYRWERCIITPRDHPLTTLGSITLADVARYPLVTYVFGFTGRSKLDEAFRNQQLQPQVVFTATDADVIKTYVRLGIGIGIIARMAYDQKYDEDLAVQDASHLFDTSVTRIGFRRGVFQRSFMYHFVKLFAPHLTTEVLQHAQRVKSAVAMASLIEGFSLPTK
jgi:LysR family cys regulon transcriptional activator